MNWKLKFISEKDFMEHVKATIEKYGEKLESFDVKRMPDWQISSNRRTK